MENPSLPGWAELIRKRCNIQWTATKCFVKWHLTHPECNTRKSYNWHCYQTLFFHFLNYQNTGYLYDITFIFDRCDRSSAAKTPKKFGRESIYRTYNFAISKLRATEKFANGALVTPRCECLLTQSQSNHTAPIYYPVVAMKQPREQSS